MNQTDADLARATGSAGPVERNNDGVHDGIDSSDPVVAAAAAARKKQLESTSRASSTQKPDVKNKRSTKSNALDAVSCAVFGTARKYDNLFPLVCVVFQTARRRRSAEAEWFGVVETANANGAHVSEVQGRSRRSQVGDDARSEPCAEMRPMCAHFY